MPLLGELYQSVTATENATFWWVGDEHNWNNVYCAFEHGKMIAKGQVSIVNIVPPGRLNNNCHSIYLNLKTITERENDFALLEDVYEHVFIRAQQLKQTLSNEYATILCVGNDATEIANNEFFRQKGYVYLNSLYGMTRALNEPIIEVKLAEGFQFSQWKMETVAEQQHYLDLETEVWPDTPLGSNKLAEYQKNELWTSMVIRQQNIIVAGLMVWKEDDDGVIEDVFVRETWRKRGFARYLLTQALSDLKAKGLPSANLEVFTTNASALCLYQSVGFRVVKEERRCFINLE